MSTRIESKPMRAGVATTILSGLAAIYFIWSPFYLHLLGGNKMPWGAECIAGFGITIASLLFGALALFVATMVISMFIIGPVCGLYTWVVNGEADWSIGIEIVDSMMGI